MNEKISLIHIEEGEFSEVDSALTRFQTFYASMGSIGAASAFIKLRAEIKKWFLTHENCMNFDISISLNVDMGKGTDNDR